MTHLFSLFEVKARESARQSEDTQDQGGGCRLRLFVLSGHVTVGSVSKEPRLLSMLLLSNNVYDACVSMNATGRVH